ncbi:MULTISPECIES: cobalamin B12-binding domain-containing protein [Facklamia]|uniref:Methanosarcina family methyltransferase cognate corrinoid protein n=2 Tax=Facklamia hominis TaxID=178214 RepID=K1LWT5_9LACT|nr:MULTISPECIES: corrinoid protein [Facklamia]EKB54538.1 methanosarcina family methyltransferase cognate corrinoid protein [Facklamia hominis CCUG 36813]EPH12148.1 methanosarcina family methyltransferase cognate corrinoid protein [Facklamia hominis ACS-120-V-Sch10]MDK7187515.1 corrinoid protein [Facklamia hominis]OFL65789.1 cobalamin-binding protein [Facklamia sp. HMSC062C11]PKY93097.1 cobalamin-binding protein [Facklamia hominis]
MRDQKELLEELKEFVVEMEDDDIIETAKEYVEGGYDVNEGVDALVDGMTEVGQLFAEEEYYVTDVLISADAMNNAMEVFEPLLMDQKKEGSSLGKIVISTVKGDTHDIGKNLVATMLEVGGFEIIDLGRDTPSQEIIDKAVEVDADIIALSALMTTTMTEMKNLIDLLKDQGLRDRFKVMIGGGAVTASYADEIGADAYSKDANEAVIVAKQILGHQS